MYGTEANLRPRAQQQEAVYPVRHRRGLFPTSSFGTSARSARSPPICDRIPRRPAHSRPLPRSRSFVCSQQLRNSPLSAPHVANGAKCLSANGKPRRLSPASQRWQRRRSAADLHDYSISPTREGDLSIAPHAALLPEAPLIVPDGVAGRCGTPPLLFPVGVPM